MDCQPDTLWREKDTGRLLKVFELRPDDMTVWWTYCDREGTPVPHGVEPANGRDYQDWFQHCCDLLDFIVWGRFVRVEK